MTTAPTALRDYRDLPGPRPLPILGNLHQTDLKSFHRTLEAGVAQHGTMYRYRMGRVPCLVIAEQAVIASLLRDRPERFTRGARVSGLLDELGATGLFTAEGEAWRRQRKLVTRAFTPEVVRKFHPTLARMVARLHERWAQQVAAGDPARGAPDLARDLKALTLDVTIALAMGHDIDTLRTEGHPLQRDIHHLFHAVGARARKAVDHWHVLKLPADRAIDAAAARVHGAVRGFIAEARQQLEDEPALRERPANLMQALLAARDEQGQGLSEQAVVGNAVTMVFAGEDTTSTTLAWTLILLAQHPEAAQRLADECDAVMGSSAAVITEPALLDRLPYTEAVLHESMRLKPAAPMLVLQGKGDEVVGDVKMPAGVRAMLLLRRAANIEANFADPQAFRPERWLGHSDAASEPNRRMMPFGAGPRFCPGRFLALVEAKMVLATVAHAFRLEALPGIADVKEIFTFTMNPSSVPVRLVPR